MCQPSMKSLIDSSVVMTPLMSSCAQHRYTVSSCAITSRHRSSREDHHVSSRVITGHHGSTFRSSAALSVDNAVGEVTHICLEEHNETNKRESFGRFGQGVCLVSFIHTFVKMIGCLKYE